MDDMNAFERQVARDALQEVGPVRSIDDAAIFDAITATQSPKWRFGSMFSATKFVVAGVILALFGGFLLAGVLTQPSEETAPMVGASASATAQAEPTTEATAESEPVPETAEVPPSDSNLGPGTFTSTGSLDRARWTHTATLLSDGRVLVVGGSEGTDYVKSVEAWDPVTGSFSPAGSLADGRWAHTATLLADGRVLVVGGSDVMVGFTNGLASGEIWDPASESFGPAGALLQSRGGHTATLLSDGRVLVVGGVVVENQEERFLASAEIWDPATESFSPAGSLDAARTIHTATLLPDGRVLVVGGVGGVGGAKPDRAIPAAAEIWDPATESFSAAGPLLQPRGRHSATLLPDGRVLVIGGRGRDFAPAEIWDPSAESFTSTGSLAEGRWWHAATLLADGRVLVVGGMNAELARRTDAEIWDPAANSPVPAASPIEAREAPSLTALPDGRALLVGGSGANGVLASAEVWEPGERQPEAGDVATTTTSDLLPGVDLVTEEVEPGVYRVLNDGVRDVVADEVHAGLDGTILALDHQGCGNRGRKVICSGYRLGDPGTFPLHQGRRTIRVHEVGPRGTVWAETFVQGNPQYDLRSWNGRRWVERVADGNYRRKGVIVANRVDLAIGPDGSAWAVEDRDDGPRLVDIADGGHRKVPDVRPEFLRSSIDGRLILVDDGDRTLRIDADGPDVFGDATYVPTERSRFVGVSPAGVHWWLSDFTEANVPRSLVSHDGEDWESFEIPEGIPWWPLAVTHDGSVWLGSWTADRLPGVTTGGVHRFDGSGWTTFFRDRIVNSLDQAANGMVWLAAADGSEVYVITPEAVAATD